MRRCVLSIASLLAGLSSPRPRGQAPDTGSIAGHVKLTPRIKGAALPSTAYPTRAVGAHDPTPLPEIRNVVVYLKDVAFRGALPPTTAELRQEHETFVPHVLAITRGSTVDFPNDDPIFHNVFSLSSAATFDLRRYPRGQSRSQTFHEGRHREGLLPHPLAHERDDPRAGPSRTSRSPALDGTLRAAERPAGRVHARRLARARRRADGVACASSAARPRPSTCRCRSRTPQ